MLPPFVVSSKNAGQTNNIPLFIVCPTELSRPESQPPSMLKFANLA
jgi:hypothetical protein